MALKLQPLETGRLLDVLTDTVIAWLRAQLEVLHDPRGILLLDDIVGMLSPVMFEQIVRPRYARIFAAFDRLIRVFHNDTPCERLLRPMSTLGFNVFNFSHETDIALVREAMPGIVLMGNVPPLGVMARGTPAEVRAWAAECIRKTRGEGLILSAGGGASPGTRPENIDALVEAAAAAESSPDAGGR